VALRVLDREAVLKGLAAAVVICLPLALIAAAIDDGDDQSAWVVPLFFGVLVGFAVGGVVAARNARDYPYSNGGVAALAAFAVIQGIAVVIRLVGDESIPWVEIVFTGLLAYGAGLTGGIAGARNRR
jgi:putative membrane protein (TIGR04086 family)